MTHPSEEDKIREAILRKEDFEERVRIETTTLERDLPIRESFHVFLQTMGYQPRVLVTPKPGYKYPGSHIETLWKCYLHATLTERNRHHDK
jgi:hypothetical protein